MEQPLSLHAVELPSNLQPAAGDAIRIAEIAVPLLRCSGASCASTQPDGASMSRRLAGGCLSAKGCGDPAVVQRLVQNWNGLLRVTAVLRLPATA